MVNRAFMADFCHEWGLGGVLSAISTDRRWVPVVELSHVEYGFPALRGRGLARMERPRKEYVL